MISRGLNYIRDYIGNLTTDAKINYIVENRDWSIKEDGREIVSRINPVLKSRISTTHIGLRNKIIHFGSINTFSIPHESNRTVLTWFHIEPDDKRLERIREIGKHVEILHTTNQITRQAFVNMGADEDKIVTIPLGVNLTRFTPISEIDGYWELRSKFGIPPYAKVIGSFQKDGAGWGEGLEPKLVKNPRMFVDVIKKLNDQYDGKIFVLLLGAARGYVKKWLKYYGIPFKHIYLKNFSEVPKYYQVLDLYLVTSIAEGMPKAIMECMASGIPIISTKVGIAPEIIENGINGYVVDINDNESMIDRATTILSNDSHARTIKKHGLETAQEYSWDIIAKRYYDEIYQRLL